MFNNDAVKLLVDGALFAGLAKQEGVVYASATELQKLALKSLGITITGIDPSKYKAQENKFDLSTNLAYYNNKINRDAYLDRMNNYLNK